MIVVLVTCRVVLAWSLEVEAASPTCRVVLAPEILAVSLPHLCTPNLKHNG